MTRYESVEEAVGGTPLIRLTKTGLRPRVYVKPEWLNPGGSVADRAALAMLRTAEADGSLRPGGTVVAATSGDIGIGLALFGARLGYRTVIFTRSHIASTTRELLDAHGAELRIVDDFVPDAHPHSPRSQAERFVEQTPGAWLANPYENPANTIAHYGSTGPEIWADTAGGVTHFVATLATDGTISGAGRFLKEISGGRVRVIGADRLDPPLADTDDRPNSPDLTVIDRFEVIDDRTAIDTIHELARREGILAGGSSGVALAAALRLAATLGDDDTVVALLPDSGRAVLPTYYDDAWLLRNGFRRREGPVVADALVEPTAQITSDAEPAAAVEVLQAASVTADEPVLVVHPPQGRSSGPHASDVLGWTTLAALRGSTSVTTAARPGAPQIGAGQAPADGLTTASAAAPGWAVAVVLSDGRVAGAVTREALEALAVSSLPRFRAPERRLS